MSDEPSCVVYTNSKRWYLNDKLHRMDGPAIEWEYGGRSWYINDMSVVYVTKLLVVGQSIPHPWYGYDSVALVISQINPILFQILIGNKKEYLFYQEITQTDFAKKVGVSREYINLIAHRKTNPGKKLALAIEKETDGKVEAKMLLARPLNA